MHELRTWNEKIINELIKAASYLSEMVNNTLDISKLEAGKIEFNPLYQSIHTAIDMVIGITRANAAKKEITLEAEYSRLLPDLVELDKARITQVVMNLVGNAIKFSNTGDKIKVLVNWRWKCGYCEGNCDTCPASRNRSIEKTKTSVIPKAEIGGENNKVVWMPHGVDECEDTVTRAWSGERPRNRRKPTHGQRLNSDA